MNIIYTVTFIFDHFKKVFKSFGTLNSGSKLISRLSIMLCLIAIMSAETSYAQPAGYYSFSTATNGSLVADKDGNPIDMSVSAILYGPNVNGSVSYTAAILPIGFNLTFAGTTYTQFSVNPNGAVRLGGSPILGFTAQAPAVGIAKIIVTNMLGKTAATGAVQYKTQPGTGGLVTIVEWKDLLLPSTATGTTLSTYQLRIYEATGQIEMVYGQMWNSQTSTTTGSVALSSGGTATTIGCVTDITNTMTYTQNSIAYTNSTFPLSAAMPNLNSAADGSRRVFTFTPPPNCVTPASQPATLALTPVPFTTTSITGSFAPAPTNPDGYLVVRYPTGSSITDPVNGISYANNATLGLGTVIQLSNLTTFTASSLTISTTYDFVVYSANFVCSGGPPYYNIVSPLLNTATTNGPGVPSCPTTFTPASGATGVATTVQLQWSGQIGTPSIFGFDVYLSTNSAAVSGLLPSAKVATNQAASPFTPLTILGTTLAPATQYFWTVVSINAVGNASACVVNSFTTSNPGNFTSTAIGGIWSEGATWDGGVAPGFADNVTIATGSNVTINNPANTPVTVNNLTINGQLQWGVNPNTMSAIGNILINPTGRFLPFTTTGTGNTINIGGDFINNGYANCAVGIATATILNFNGSQQGGGSLAQTLGGNGVFEGDNNYGIIRTLQFQTTGNSTLANNLARPLCVYSFTHTAGSLQTNGKLRIDNTRQNFGMPLNTQISNVVVTTTGTGYGTNPPVIFGAFVTKWTPSTLASVAARFFSGNNVYLVTTAGTFGTIAPTHTGTTPVLNGSVGLLYIGVLGTLGNPYITTALTVGTQYFYGNNLYVAVNTSVPGIAAAPPTHTSGIGGPGNSFLYQGSVAIATPNFDAATSTLRSITLTNPGSGYTVVPLVSFGTTGTSPTVAPVAAVNYFPQLVGTNINNSTFTKGNSATIAGGIAINSDQGVSAVPGASMSGVGSLSLTTTTTTGAGVNYTTAPLVGFGFPTGINLVTNGGAYTVAPTVQMTGGTKVLSGATDPSFTVVVNRGKVVAVYVGSSGSGWLTPPTLSFTGGTGSGGTLAFPAGCLATADVVLGTNRQVANFTITNPGFGYVSPPTVVMNGGAFVGGGLAATVTAPVPRLALYSLTYGYLAPATTNITNVEGAEVPANRKMNSLTMSSPGVGAKFNSKIELFAVTPLSLTYGKIDMNGDTLLFTNSFYTGNSVTSLLTCVANGTVVLTTRGGGAAGQTLNFPFDAPFTLFTGTGSATNGSTAMRISATQVAAPTGGVSPNFTIGNRSYKLNLTSGDTLGTGRKVTLNYNSSDGLSNTMQQKYLLVGDANATSGPWTVRSDSTGATALLAPVGNRSTFITPTIIDSTGSKYYCWMSNSPSPSITSIAPANFCSGGGETALIKGAGFTGTTSVKFNGLDAQSFTVNTTGDTILAIVPAGVTDGNIVVTSVGTPASFAFTASNTGNFTATQSPSNLLICSVPGSASISLNNIGADSYIWTGGPGLDTYTGLNVVASPTTSTQYTMTAAFASFGCSVITKFNVGVVTSVAPSPTATPSNSCFGSSTTIALNSNLSSGNFGVSSIPYAASNPPANASTIISNGIVTPGYVLGGNLNDGGFPNIPIGFNYNYFGNVFSTLAISTNGVLMFGPVPGYGTADGQLGAATFTATNGLVFPNPIAPANIISLFTADMNSLATWAPTAAIRYWTEGVAPTRRFVIQFKDWGNLNSTTLLNNVECMLYETTGIVEIHITNYATAAKTIGLQDATKTIGAVAPGRQQFTTGITTPEAWRFIPPAAYTYAWSPSTYLNDPTLSAPTFTIPASGTYTYSLDITNPTTSCVINKQVTFKVNPTPAAPTISGTLSVCGSGSTALFSNTPAVGNSINWYNGSIGGTLVSSGNLYVTPVVTRDTTFYVAEQSSLCSSPRTAVTVTVNAPPAFTVNDSVVCGNATYVPLRTKTNTSDYDTYIWSPTTNLYQDAALNTPYSGQSLSTVYLKVTTAATLNYICNVNSFTSLCSSRDTATITIQPVSASISANTVSICKTGTANLTLVTASTPATGTIQWQFSTNGTTFNDIVGATLTTYTTPVLTSTTYYRVQIKDQSNAVCITSSPITIAVINPQPSSTTGNSRCGTGTTMLTATAASGILNWYGVATAGTSLGAGTSFVTPFISTTTTFYVGLTINSCEGDRVPVIATVSVPAPLTPDTKKIICNNTITALTVTPGSPSDFDSYVWSPVTNLFQDAGATISYSGQNQQTVYTRNPTSGTTVYTCLATNTVSSCSNVANDTVIVLPVTATASATVTNICTTGTTVLSLTPSTTYGATSIHWQSSTDNITFNDIVGGNTTPFTTATLSVTTYFRAQVYNSAPAVCFTSNTLTIVVNPVITGSTGASRCGIGSVSLTATSAAGNTFKWYAALSGGTSIGTGSPFSTPAIGTTTTYYVTANAGSCESSPRTAVVATVNTPPALTSSPKQVVCNNVITTLTATPINISDFDSYIWSPATNLFEDASATTPYSGASLTTVYARTATAGTTTYICTATNNTTNCVNQAKDTVIVQVAAATITPNTTTFCVSGTTTLSLNPSTPYATGSIQWQTSADNITFTDIASANSTNYVTPTLLATKYFRARISNGVSICVTTDTATLIINNPQPTSANSNSRCGTGSVALTASAASGTINWYAASTGGTSLATGSPFNTPSISATTSYYVSVTDGGCAGTRSLVTATINTAPTLTNVAKQVACNNSIVTLTATTINPTDFDTYVWSPVTNLYTDALATNPYTGGNQLTVYQKSPTAGQVVYTVNATNSTTFCTNATNDTVFVQPVSVAITPSPASICILGSATLSLLPSSPYADNSIKWSISDDNINYNDTLGSTNTITTQNYTTTKYFKVRILDGSSATCLTTAVDTLRYLLPQVLSTTNATRCGNGSVVLNATGSPGSILKWYSVPTGGTPLISGPTFTTPPVSSTTIYYINDSIQGCTSGRMRDTAFVNAPPDLSITPSSIVCNNEITPLTITSSVSDYTSYIWSPTVNLFQDASASIPYSGQNLSTVYARTSVPGSQLYTCNGTNPSSNCASQTSMTFTVQPAAASVSSTPALICINGTGVLNLAPSTPYAPGTIQWQRSSNGTSFNDIPAAINPTYSTPVLAATRYYQVVIKNGAGATCFTTPVYNMVVNNPQVTNPVPATRCGIGPVTVSATPSAGSILNWYSSSTGGALLATGNSYTSPSIGTTTDYWVEAKSIGTGTTQISNNGVPTTITTAVNAGLQLSVNQDLTLNSVDVYATIAGNITIVLQNSAGIIIAGPVTNTVVAGTTTVPQTLPLGFTIQAGSGYRLLVTTNPGGLGFHTGAFPYLLGNGVGSITSGWLGSATTGPNYFLYNLNTSTGCLSGKTRVTATVTTPPALTLTSPQAICNNAITSITVTSNPADYDNHKWSPVTNLFQDAAATIPYTGQNLSTVYVKGSTVGTTSYTDSASSAVSSCGNIATTSVLIQPATATSSASPAEFCISGNSTLKLNPVSPYGTSSVQWQSSTDNINFTDISGGTGTPYVTATILNSGFFRAVVKDGAGATCFTTNTNTIIVNNPQLASLTDGSRCGIGTVNLSASGLNGVNVVWYADSTGGAALDTANTFTTPVISHTTNFWVSAAMVSPQTSHLGLPGNIATTTSGTGTTTYGLVFDVFTPFTLHDVTLYPVSATSSAGTITINVSDAAGVVLFSKIVNVVGSPLGSVIPQTVILDFNLQPGLNYKLTPAGFTGITSLLFESASGAPGGNYGYPFTFPGVVSIKTSTLVAAPVNTPNNDLYYYFYNWTIYSGCESARAKVIANVVPPAALTLTAPDSICTNTVKLFTVTSNSADYDSYVWSPNTNLYLDAAHTIAYSGGNTDSVYFYSASNVSTTTYTCTANNSVSNCVNIATTSIKVRGVDITSWSANPSTICEGSVVTLSATSTNGAGTLVWQWSPGGFPTGNIVTATPSATTTYTITATDILIGCSASRTVTVTVYPVPSMPAASAPSTQCGYGIPHVSVISGGGNLNWYTTPGGLIPIQTGPADTLTSYTINSTTTFYVSESDGQCESGRVPVIANVTSSDPVSAVTTSQVCANSVLTLSMTQTGNTNNYSSVVWSASPAAGSGIPTTVSGSTVNVTPTLSGAYIYTVIANDPVSHCSATDTISVTVKNAPTIAGKSATPNPVCAGGDVILEAHTGTISSVIANVGTNTTTLGPTFGNPYRTGAGGSLECRSNFLVLASELTSAGFMPGDITSLGFTTTAAAGSLINFTIKIGYTPLTALATSYNTGPMTTVFTQSTFSPVLGLNTHVFQTPFNWDGVSNIIVEVCNMQSVTGGTTVAAWTPSYSPSIGNSNPNGCSVATGTAVASKPIMRFGGLNTILGPGNLVWTWNPGNLSGNTVTTNPSSNTNYIVTALDTVTGCSSNDSIQVVTIPVPAAPTAINSIQCGFGVPKCKVSGSVGTFHWYLQSVGGTAIPGENGDTLTGYVVDSTTTFYVSQFDGTCNSVRVAVTATVTQPDHLLLTASADSVCANSILTLSASQIGSTNNYSFAWSSTPATGSGLIGSETNDTISVSPAISGSRTYTITGIDAVNGCSTHTTKHVFVKQGPTVPVPTASPSAICPGSTSQLNAHPFVSGSGSLSTGNAAGNGSTAIFFDVENSSSTLPITLHYVSVLTAGVSATAYFLPGGLTSCTAPPVIANFIQVGGTVAIVPNGNAPGSSFTLVPIDLNVTIPPLGKVAVCIATDANLAYSNGVGGCPVIASDALIRIHEGFGGTTGSPFASRVFNGNVTYTYLANSPSLTFDWTPGSTLSDPAISNPVASPTATTNYSVAVTDPATLCSAIGSVQVTVNTTAGTLSVNANPSSICNSGHVALAVGTVVPGVTYNWQQSATGNPGTWTNIGTGSSFTTNTITANANFRVYSSCGLAGDTSQSVLVTVINPQVVSASAPSRCGTGPVTFSATGNGQFDWYTTQTNGTPIASDTNAYTAFLTSTTTLWVEAHSGSCFNPNRVLVTAVIFNAPVASVAVSPNDTICSGTSVSLTASSANTNYTFYWTLDLVNAIDTDVVHTFIADSSRTYNLYAVDSSHQANHGCAFLVPVPIVVNQTPATPVISPVNPTICNVGGCVDLNVVNAVATYTWNPGNFTGVQYHVCPAQTTAYTVTANGGNGCTATTSVTVNYDPVTPPVIAANGSTTICPSGSVTLDAGTGYSNYSWFDGTNVVGTSQTYLASPSVNTTYTVTVSDGGPCTASASQTITISAITPPAITTVGNTTFCQGGSSTLNAGPGYSGYSWSDGANVVGTSQTLVVTTSGTYTVTVSSGASCTATASQVIVVHPLPPVPTVTPTGPVDLCDDGSNSPVVLTADTTGAGAGAALQWNNVDNTPDASVSVYFDALDFVIYGNSVPFNLKVTNIFGCNAVSSDVTVNLVHCTPPPLTLNAKLFIEGYYTGGGKMDNYGTGGCLLYSGVNGALANQSDTITLSLMAAAAPHGFIAKAKGIMLVDGTVTVTYPGTVPMASYYIKITHRNALETWSALPVAIGSVTSYDFTTAANKAFGNNMTDVGTMFGESPKWAIYSGDISDANVTGLGLGYQDLVIEAQDYLDMENAVAQIKFGYDTEDITGDGIVEAADYLLMENAVAAIRFSYYP